MLESGSSPLPSYKHQGVKTQNSAERRVSYIMMLPRVIHSKYVLVFLAMGSGTKGNFYFVTYLCIFLQQKYG